MASGFDIPTKAPMPLSAEDAYWHACTGTVYEPVWVFVMSGYRGDPNLLMPFMPGIPGWRIEVLSKDPFRARYVADDLQ